MSNIKTHYEVGLSKEEADNYWICYDLVDGHFIAGDKVYNDVSPDRFVTESEAMEFFNKLTADKLRIDAPDCRYRDVEITVYKVAEEWQWDPDDEEEVFSGSRNNAILRKRFFID